MDVGQHIRRIRTEKEITLAAMSKALGLTSSALSQIESCKNTPSLETLSAILKYLDVAMSDFFRQIEKPAILIAKNEEVETIHSEKGSRVVLLASKLKDNTLESFCVELQPSTNVTVKTLRKQVNGERFIFVRKGRLRAVIENTAHDLHKEDSINFKAHHSCTIYNVSSTPVRFIICGFPPVL